MVKIKDFCVKSLQDHFLVQAAIPKDIIDDNVV